MPPKLCVSFCWYGLIQWVLPGGKEQIWAFAINQKIVQHVDGWMGGTTDGAKQNQKSAAACWTCLRLGKHESAALEKIESKPAENRQSDGEIHKVRKLY